GGGCEAPPAETRALAHAEPRGVEQLEDRAIAQTEAAVRARRGEQTVDVVEGQMRGQLARRLRRGDGGRRVVGDAVGVDEEAEKTADGGELPRDGAPARAAVERAQPA